METVQFMNVAKDDALAWPKIARRTYPATTNNRMESTIVPFVRNCSVSTWPFWTYSMIGWGCLRENLPRGRSLVGSKRGVLGICRGHRTWGRSREQLGLIQISGPWCVQLFSLKPRYWGSLELEVVPPQSTWSWPRTKKWQYIKVCNHNGRNRQILIAKTM